MSELRITLPWPAKELQPNSRPHYMVKAKAAKNHRYHASLVATAERREVKWKTRDSATVEVLFYDPVKRKRDRDNHLAACKPYFDGFADAGVIANDSGFTYLPVRFEVGKRRVEILIY